MSKNTKPKTKTNPPIKPKRKQVKIFDKYCGEILFFIYLFKVYGSLILNKYMLISDEAWCSIHFVGNCILFCSFLYLLRSKVNSFIYSLFMAVFVSRLITQLSDNGKEYWYEMMFVIMITSLIYFISKYKTKWISKKQQQHQIRSKLLVHVLP